MTFGTRFKQGDILITPFPYTDLTSIKQRPVLVISNDEYNFNAEDLIVCAITSNLKDTKYSVFITNKNLVDGYIPADSRIKVDKIITLKSSLVKKKLAHINNKTFEEVKSEISKMF